MDSFEKSYCAFVKGRPADDLHKVYHDHHYGFPIYEDNELFGRLILEINQAGLSWSTILKKQDNFRLAYAEYDINQVAAFGPKDIEALLSNAGIIRNKLKVNAAIYNAGEILKLQKEHGSFRNWILDQGNLELNEWVKRFRKHFKFVGGEIVKEFLMSAGFIPGAHHPRCPIQGKIEATKAKP